jgi:hypothetical protein
MRILHVDNFYQLSRGEHHCPATVHAISSASAPTSTFQARCH